MAASFPQNIFDSKDASNLVGDELSDQHAKFVEAGAMLKEKREKIYQIAGEKYDIERELVGYIDWLKEDIESGAKDIVRCDDLENELNLISTLHGECYIWLKFWLMYINRYCSYLFLIVAHF